MSKVYKKILIFLLVFGVTVIVYVVVSNIQKSKLLQKTSGDTSTVPIGSIVVRDVRLQNDFEGAKINPKDLVDGCRGKDCIPAISNPKFETVEKATWLTDNDVVFTISHKNINRAYPQRIMNWHEIVNDTIAGDPIVITFCPLCGSAVAYERVVSGVVTEFGVSGKLHQSDLVMYDRYEGNLWQQISGEALVGPAARRDEKLELTFLGTTTWAKWKEKYPDGQVLSRETGLARNYEWYPYGTYEQDDELYFVVKDLNKKLQIKTVVYGMEIGGASRAYPASIFDETPVIEDVLGETKIKLEKLQSGEVEVTDVDTQQKIIPLRLFWFAWAAFHPTTDIYQIK